MTTNENTVRVNIITNAELEGIHRAMDATGQFTQATKEQQIENSRRLREQNLLAKQGRFDDQVTMQAVAVKRKEDNAFYKSSVIDINQKMNLEKQSRAEQKQYWMERETDIKAEIATETSAQKEITNARNEKIKAIKLENMELKQNAQAATQSLGANLGLLFATMGVARALSSSAMYLEKYGIVSEKTGKKIRVFTDTFNVASQFFTGYVSFMMLVQAVEARRSQELINQNIQRNIAIQRETSITTQVATQNALRSGGAAGAGLGASAGMAAAIPYVGIGIGVAALALMGYSMYKSSKHAFGGDEMVTSPTWKLVGERENERFSATPVGSSGGGGGGTTIFQISGYMDDDMLKKKLGRIWSDVQRGIA